MKSRCLFVGRFQPFHSGHHKTILSLLEKYDEVIVLIGSAETKLSLQNPFSTGERIEMIRVAFNKEITRLIIIPVRDVNNHSLWVSHVLQYVPIFRDVYSNNEIVRKLFSDKGFKVHQIPYVDRNKKEGKTIRQMILENDDQWKKHIPDKTVEFIQSIKGEKRIRELR